MVSKHVFETLMLNEQGEYEMHNFGIDVSKEKLDCCYLLDASSCKSKQKTFKNNPAGLKALRQWLLSCYEGNASDAFIVLEATGVYHQPLAYALFEAGFQLSVVNPARAKQFAKSQGQLHKTDARDSLNLALFGHHNTLRPWRPEAPEIRELKALLSRLEALDIDLQRESNRLEKASFESASTRVIESLELMIERIKAEKRRLEEDIDDHIQHHPKLKKDRGLLSSIPGIGPVLSRIMLSILHSRDFSRAEQVAAFIGLIPRIEESGKWKGRSRLSKTGSAKVRAKLYMAAVVCLRANPDIQAQYQRLVARGKHKMQAIGAAMRKLVQICFGVLKHQSEYRPQVAI